MSININDKIIINYSSSVKEKSISQKTLLQKSIELFESNKSKGPKNNLNKNLVSNIGLNTNNHNLLFSTENKIIQNPNKNKNSNQVSAFNSPKTKFLIFNISKCRKKKITNRRHGANAKDNIRQTIIRHFVNFFFTFVNMYIKKIVQKKKIKLGKEIQFKIYYKDKAQIKLKDILYSSIKQLLLFEPNKTFKKDKDKSKNEKNYVSSNKELFNEINNDYDLTLDTFFKKPVIDIFKDIYLNERKDIDLKKYEIKLKLPKKIKNFNMLKRKYKNKEKIMVDIVQNQFINRNIFKVKK